MAPNNWKSVSLVELFAELLSHIYFQALFYIYIAGVHTFQCNENTHFSSSNLVCQHGFKAFFFLIFLFFLNFKHSWQSWVKLKQLLRLLMSPKILSVHTIFYPNKNLMLVLESPVLARLNYHFGFEQWEWLFYQRTN